MTQQRLYRLSEIAELFAVSERHVYRLIASGSIDAVQIGDSRCTRISQQSIEEFLERKKIPKPRGLRAVIR